MLVPIYHNNVPYVLCHICQCMYVITKCPVYIIDCVSTHNKNDQQHFSKSEAFCLLCLLSLFFSAFPTMSWQGTKTKTTHSHSKNDCWESCVAQAFRSDSIAHSFVPKDPSLPFIFLWCCCISLTSWAGTRQTLFRVKWSKDH